MKLNIGSFTVQHKDMINIDIDKAVKPDVVCDTLKLPFKSGTFDYVHMSSILEHADCFEMMKDVHMVCKRGAIVEIWMPHWSGYATWAHLQHKRGGSYFMFDEGREKQYGFEFEVLERRILIEGREYPQQKTAWTRWHLPMLLIEKIANRFPESFERLWCYWVGGAEALYFKLKVKK